MATLPSATSPATDPLGRWGNTAAAPLPSPVLIEPNRLVCPSAARPPADVPISIALNRIDFAELGLAFRFYEPPSFTNVFPALGSSNGGVRVTISGSGFLGFSTLLTLGRCRWGKGLHTTELLSLTDEQIEARGRDLEDAMPSVRRSDDPLLAH